VYLLGAEIVLISEKAAANDLRTVEQFQSRRVTRFAADGIASLELPLQSQNTVLARCDLRNLSISLE
jgi:hypothetical protein